MTLPVILSISFFCLLTPKNCFNVKFSLDVTYWDFWHFNFSSYFLAFWPVSLSVLLIHNMCISTCSSPFCETVFRQICFPDLILTSHGCITLQHSTMLSCRLCFSWECQSQIKILVLLKSWFSTDFYSVWLRRISCHLLLA